MIEHEQKVAPSNKYPWLFSWCCWVGGFIDRDWPFLAVFKHTEPKENKNRSKNRG
jgi:hypothetical protein